MKMKNIHINIVVLLAFILLFNTSCSEWLNVKPKSEVEDEEMFATEKGYFDALMGVYVKMGEKSLYGDNLTMTTLDLLAQNYNVDSDKLATSFLFFDFNTVYAENIFSGIWSNMYNAIANCNNIIDHIKKDDSNKFLDGNYNLIYGEALALRALLHFDLLRMFHPSYLSRPDFKGIPYIGEFTKDLTEQYTSEEVIKNVLDDLSNSYEMLKNVDPVISETEIETKVLSERKIRANYYAVAGLLARVYLYSGDYTNAYKYANEVIESKSFRFIKGDEIIPQLDFTYTSEHLFSLFVSRLGENSRRYFSDDASSEMVCAQSVKDRFGSNDLRFKYWFKTITSNGAEKRYLTKYYRPLDEDEEEKYVDPVIPIVKLSEMYLIAAECMSETNLTEAVSLMEELHEKRGSDVLGEISDKESLIAEIIKEYQREFIGEGQLFYLYKRLNLSSIKGIYGFSISMDDSKYTFPLPNDEIEFGGRTTN